MATHAVDRPTGAATIWIVLRYVSACVAALPSGVASALVFCVVNTGGAEALRDWASGAGSHHDPTFPGPGWILLFVLLGCAGLAPAFWAAWRLPGRAGAHGRIALAVCSVLTVLVAGLVVGLLIALASVTAAIALP